MKNKNFFIKKIEESSLIRKILNNTHHKRMNNLSTIFKLVFDRDASEFIHAKNILYYKGGWPSENTPPRAKSLANSIANAYIILSYIGQQQELEEYLSDKGINISFKNNMIVQNYFKNEISDSNNNKKLTKALKLWKDTFDIPFVYSSKELMKILMENVLKEQVIICKLADEIKITNGEEVKDKCDIKNVSNFTNLVNFEVKYKEGKDVDKPISKVSEKISETTECLNVFKENNL